MDSLTRLAYPEKTWYLEEFTEIANQLLAEYLPTNPRDLNPRLVRYYTSQGLLDDPHRLGKYAVYTYRHLLQLLVVRKLMNEGIGISAIGQITSKKTNQELENFLKGDIKLEVNPALTFLETIKNRETIASSPVSVPQVNTWFHLEIIPGLELHLRSDFQYPDNPYQQKILQEKLLQTLKDFITQQHKGKP